jgi:two-component system sensor histidine kinase PilS (NtrC family)
VVVFQDLTPIRTMEERVRMSDRLAALGELAAGFAHEVRNPLASIAGSSQMLQEVPRLPEETRPLVEIIGRESRRLDALITDFLAFSTPIRPAAPGAVDLSTLAGDVAEAIRTGEGREKGVSVECSGEEGVCVKGSREELSQVVWNLARNAVQAGGEGNAVTLAVSRQGRQGESFGAVTVTDRGGGIDPSVRGRIFSPFFTTKEGGTGLGLAICQRIVHGHQGFIEVTSRPGEGASFTVLVPLSTGEDDVPGGPS